MSETKPKGKLALRKNALRTLVSSELRHAAGGTYVHTPGCCTIPDTECMDTCWTCPGMCSNPLSSEPYCQYTGPSNCI